MAQLAIVGFYLSINALVLIWLSAKVIGVRRGNQISIGDGDNKTLAYYIRGQGNAAEYMPMFFIMLGIAALINTPPVALHALGVAFTIGRILHASWFVKPSPKMSKRVSGMVLTFLSMGILALGLFAHAIVIMAQGY